MTLKSNANSVPLAISLSRLESEGVRLYLNGVPSNTENIVKNCVNEDAVYMPDYVTDENGVVKEIWYDQIC